MHISIRSVLWLFFFALVSVASARAEVAVIRPASADDPLSDRAQSALSTALSRAGVTALEPEQVRRRLQAAVGSSCSELDCLRPLLRTLGADMVASVTVTSDSEVLVLLVDAAGEQSQGKARMVAKDVGGATDAAVRTALSRWPSRGLVTLTVDGSPHGATVLIDGQPRGMLPLEARVQPGQHEVTLSMDGYASAHQTVQTVEPAPSKVTFHLTASDEPVTRPGPRKLSRATLLGSTALMAAGVVTLSVALGSYARTGCVTRDAEGRCSEERVINSAPLAVWTTVGAAALVGGATWLTVAKLKARRARETQITLRAGIGQLALTGRFP